VAHIYFNDPSVTNQVRKLVEKIPGVALVLDREAQKKYHLDHERAGDLVVMADSHSWFTYYFWLDDVVAPDYARVVDIHKKPGYDPVELFMTSKGRAAYKLLRKKTGLRYVMDVIPIDATLVQGSHGSTAVDEGFYPMLVTSGKQKEDLQATDVYHIIWQHLTGA
jgi:hypothetical protein